MEKITAIAEQKPRRVVLRRTLISLGVLVGLLVVAGGGVYALAANMFNKVERVAIEQNPEWKRPAAQKPSTQPEVKQPLNILLLGSDSRIATDRNAGAETLTGFRSDAIMVAQISGDRKHATVMSIMRDNWVSIEGHGEAKINAAFSYGGLPLAVNTIENFIGARIDHVALVDFESFKGLTNALGGVTVENPTTFTTINGGGNRTFEAGPITLDGDQALSFVRERYAFTDGDYQRARNQQAYMKGLTSAILSRETLGDIGKVTALFNALEPYLILDSGLDLGTAASLGLEMKSIRPENMSFFTSPTLGTGTSGDGQSIVLPNGNELPKMREAFQNGLLHEYAAGVTAAG